MPTRRAVATRDRWALAREAKFLGEDSPQTMMLVREAGFGPATFGPSSQRLLPLGYPRIEPVDGDDPPTCRLRNGCSAAELHRHGWGTWIRTKTAASRARRAAVTPYPIEYVCGVGAQCRLVLKPVVATLSPGFRPDSGRPSDQPTVGLRVSEVGFGPTQLRV